MKERGAKTLALIPLNIDGYLFDPNCTNAKAEQIKTRLAPDFTNWNTDNNKFEEQLERVILALRIDAQARVPPPPRL